MISIIIPFYNEEDSLSELYQRLQPELNGLKKNYELIFVDDGSSDNGRGFVEKIKQSDNKIKLVLHRKRLGKGRALESGINNSKGETIVFMDADLQNDPQDLSRMIEKISEGYDLVNGYRKIRNDGIDKTMPSKIYNKLIAFLFQIKLHDINCGYKAMTKEVLQSVQLYGDNYRILPILAKHYGFRITEIEVKHHPREHGESKYGVARLLFGIIDLLSYLFLLKYVEKPLHFFGLVGFSILSLGGIILFYLAVERIFFGQLLYQRPLLFLGLLLAIVGVQIVATGFIGELVVYLNHKKNNK